MTAEEYLNRPYRIRLDISAKYEKKRELELMVLPSAIRYDKDRVDTSPNSDQISDLANELLEVDKQIENLQKKYIETLKEVEGLLKEMSLSSNINYTYAHILLHFFVYNTPVETTMTMIFNYSKGHIYRLKDKALYEFNKYWYLPKDATNETDANKNV